MKYLALLLLSASLSAQVKGHIDLRGNARPVRSGWIVSLNATPSTSSGVTSYNIYRGTVSGGPYQVIGNSPTPAYLDTTVGAHFTFFYVETAVCPTCSPQESSNSNEVSVTK